MGAIITILIAVVVLIYKAVDNKARKAQAAISGDDNSNGSDYIWQSEVPESVTRRESWSYDSEVIEEVSSAPRAKPVNIQPAQAQQEEPSTTSGIIEEFDIAKAIIYSELLKPKFND
jgi:hypothetical protein